MQQVLLVALWIGAGAVFRQPVVLAHQLGQQGVGLGEQGGFVGTAVEQCRQLTDELAQAVEAQDG